MKLNLVGRRFDLLVVIALVESTPSGQRWLCLCDCGNHVAKLTTQLMRAKHTGCRNCESLSRAASKVTHGGTLGGRSALYQIWKGMRHRCTNPNSGVWKYYGAKGVSVCLEWQDFAVFREWALAHGYVKGLTIERKDSNGDYAPGNCEWLTRSENSRRAMSGYQRARAARLDS